MGATKAEGHKAGSGPGDASSHKKTEVRRNNNNDIERFVSNIDIGRNETAERMGRAGKLRETGACALLSAGTRSFGRELSRCVNLEHLLHDSSMHHSGRVSTTSCDAARLAEPRRSLCTALPRCTRQPLCAGSFAEQLEPIARRLGLTP